VYRQSEKYLLNSSIPSMCPLNMVNLAHYRLRSVYQFRAPQQISTGFASCLRYCNDVAHRRPTRLCTVFGHLLAWYTIYTFLGAPAPDRILPSAEFTLRRSIALCYIGSVTARHSSSGRQPNFAAWCKEWNYGTSAEGTTYICSGGRHVGHWSKF